MMSQKSPYLLLCLIMIFSCCILQAQNVIYVNLNATGSNNGTTWKNAYKSLQLALDSAANNDTIWVAEGTYKPKESVSNSLYKNQRNNSFHASGKNITIYGGFSGEENQVNERDIANHPTIFSGDFKGNDIFKDTSSFLAYSNNNENAYHVFVFILVPKVVFNGVVVSGGNADEANSIFYGGEEVHDDFGGGIYSYSSSSPVSIELINSKIVGNTATNEGGGVYISSHYSASTVKIVASIISENISGRYGGGISSYSSSSSSSSVIVKNSTISGNRAAFYGGGIYSSCSTYSTSSFSTISVKNSIINGNYAGNNGGGIFSYSSSSFVKIANSVVWTHKLGGSNIYQDPQVNIDSNGDNLFSDAPNGYASTDRINASGTQREYYVDEKKGQK